MNNKQNKKRVPMVLGSTVIIMAALLLCIPMITHAQDRPLVECGGTDVRGNFDVCGWDDFLKTLGNVLNFALLYIAIPIAVIVVIIGGFQMIFSFGNESKFASGRKMITSVAIGLAMTFGAWLIVQTLLSVFFDQNFISLAHAQSIPPSEQLTNHSGINSFDDLYSTIVSWITAILAPILTIVLLIGGFQMFTARDNEAQFTKGKKIITYAIIGAAVVLLANGIILVIKSFLSVN